VKYLVVLLCLMIFITGCASNNQVGSDGNNQISGPVGEPIREASAYGFVTQVSAEEKIITIKHAPIPEMNWAPMVMPFNVANDIDLSPFQRGDKVDFVLDIDKGKNYRIKKISVVINTP